MKLLVINKQSLLVTVLLLLINFFLEYYYVVFVYEKYSYMGFELDVNIFKYIISKVLLIMYLLLSFYVYKRSFFVYSIYAFLGLFLLIPNLILFSFMNLTPGPICSIFSMLIIIAIISTNKIKLKTIKINNIAIKALLFMLAMALFIPVFYNYGFNINLETLLLKGIYETRASYGESSTLMTSYFFTWLIKVIAPILLVYGLIHKKYIYVIMSIMILLYIYLMSGLKSVYATIFLVIFFYYVGRGFIGKIKYFLILILALLVIAPVIDAYVLDSILFESLLIRRLFFLPALITYDYFHFFDSNPVYLSHSILKNFIEYPYDLEPAKLISATYFDMPAGNTNNGFISDGYMNFGYIGVISFSFVVSLIILFFNSIKLDARYFGLFFLLIRLLVSSALLTMFLTHGLWLLIIFALILMKEKKPHQKIISV